MKLTVIRALPRMAETLSDIAWRSKQYWGYPVDWMHAWRGELTVDPELIERTETWVAADEVEPVGFYVLDTNDDRSGRLEHFWIRPESMGVGAGRLLLRHTLERAEILRLSEVLIVADPNAEQFYLKHGAKRTGTEIGTVCGARRELPILSISPG